MEERNTKLASYDTVTRTLVPLELGPDGSSLTPVGKGIPLSDFQCVGSELVSTEDFVGKYDSVSEAERSLYEQALNKGRTKYNADFVAVGDPLTRHSPEISLIERILSPKFHLDSVATIYVLQDFSTSSKE